MTVKLLTTSSRSQMKLLELIDQIGNIGNRPDIEGWRTEMKAEAAKIEAVVRAARRLADLADEHLSRFPKADMPELFDLRLIELEDCLDKVED